MMANKKEMDVSLLYIDIEQKHEKLKTQYP